MNQWNDIHSAPLRADIVRRSLLSAAAQKAIKPYPLASGSGHLVMIAYRLYTTPSGITHAIVTGAMFINNKYIPNNSDIPLIIDFTKGIAYGKLAPRYAMWEIYTMPHRGVLSPDKRLWKRYTHKQYTYNQSKSILTTLITNNKKLPPREQQEYRMSIWKPRNSSPYKQPPGQYKTRQEKKSFFY